MANRPYINLGIAEIEAKFDQAHADKHELNRLVYELSFRKTRRAKALNLRVSKAFNLVKTSGPVPKAAPKKPVNVAPQILKPRTKAHLKAEPLRSFHTDIAGLQEPERVLLSWTALEILSPQSFTKAEKLCGGDKYRVARLDKSSLPWENSGEKSKRNYRLYYEVILGTIDMPPAVEGLLKIYGDKRAERHQTKGKSVIATALVDKEGRLVEDNAFSLSSFAWGLPVALKGDLTSLGAWQAAEADILAKIEKQMRRVDDEGEALPLTREDISQASAWLVQALGLSKQMCSPPSIAIKTYQYFGYPEPPDTLLLNSFYLEDLAKARALFASGKAPVNLRRYFGDIKPQHRADLLNDTASLTQALHPSMMPLGRWPSNGRFSLVTLQQAAVNLASKDLKEEGILAVNGPPGTGKTTLLRDILADTVCQRASVMAEYADPESAFKTEGVSLRRGGATLNFYDVDPRLKGFEIVVASSNNKAVENVSAELPGLETIDSEVLSEGYFKTISDNVLGQETWGLVSAVLGNAKNRAAFRRKFWHDKDFGLSAYLQYASGARPKISYEDDKGNTLQREPQVIARENPPQDKPDALRRWAKARADFKTAEIACRNIIMQATQIADMPMKIADEQDSLEALTKILSESDLKLKQCLSDMTPIETHWSQAYDSHSMVSSKVDHCRTQKPNFIKRLLSFKTYSNWTSAYRVLKDEKEKASALLKIWYDRKTALSHNINKLEQGLKKDKARFEVLKQRIAENKLAYKTLLKEFKGEAIDEAFFKKSYDDRQLAAPWIDRESSKARDDLFEASMRLHRAFIDAAAKPIRHNIQLLLSSFGTRSFGLDKKDRYLPDLWASLFMVVPAISTTFASVGRMFNNISTETFGWLLIDEAGQASPQQAVGAILRSKRAVIVGDPLQIEPVVMLPLDLTEAIFREFEVDETQYNAPAASVQTLADSATSYFASFETGAGSRHVGVPLLVHRRCSDPMFTISNTVAYNNLMVQAKHSKPSAIIDTLGQSRWIDIKGGGQEKWCPEEGQEALSLLRELKQAGLAPELYIITPFVVVQDNLRQLIRKSGVLEGWVEDSYKWPYNHIGTVHTVQGREAQSVIFVLGAPLAEQSGARNWAGARPNILNVAVSRAKESLYVIGNKSLWSKAGVFSELARRL